jgi:hypothetical protein
MIRRIVLAAIFCLLPSAGAAQVITGLPPFGSFWGGSFDTVNDANLNVFFTIPLVNKAGRGLPFYYALAYSSSVWVPYDSNNNHVWTHAGNWGWGGITSASTGFMAYSLTQGSCYSTGRWYYWNIYLYTFYYDPNGTPHQFNHNVSTWNPSWPCGFGSPPNTYTGTVSDGSGYTITVTSFPSATVYLPSGLTINVPVGAQYGQGSISDTNGNSLVVNYSGATQESRLSDVARS